MRFIIFVLLIYILYRLVKGLFGLGKEIETGGADRGVIDEMVQDPLCKTYIPRRDAVEKNIQGKAYYFCSKECAAKFEHEERP